MSAQPNAAGWRRDVPVIGLISLAHGGSHFFHLVLPPLFPFLIRDMDVSYADLGLMMSLFFATSGLLQVVAGFLVDRLGAERILIGGLVCLGTGCLIAANATGYPALLVAAVIMGTGNSVFHPADYAILSEHVDGSRLGRAYSAHTIGGSIGWALAPLAMTTIATAYDWRTALTVASVIGFTIALLVFRRRARLRIRRRSVAASDNRALDASMLMQASILLCFAFFTLQAFVIMGIQGFMPLALFELYDIDLVTAAALLTTFLIGSAAGTLAGGIVADRQVGLKPTIIAGYLSSGLGLLLVGLIAMPIGLVFALIAIAGGLQGLTTPSRDLLVRAATPPEQLGRVFGFVYSGLDLGGTVAPYLIALLFDGGRAGWYFPLLAAVTALTASTVINVDPAKAAGRAR